MVEKIETVIVGGGQAGLSLSYFLTHAGRENIVMEKSPQVADAWRNHRWDTFTLNSPNWAFRIPGGEYSGSEPDSYMPRAEIVSRFEKYEQENHLPVSYSTEVSRVDPIENNYRYRVLTDKKTYEARNVVIATGTFQKVKIPGYAKQISQTVLQITSDAYRNSESLPPGAVLVVGTAQSGCQIAEDLHDAGRKVYLSTCSAGRVPRRYRGIDVFIWMGKIGFLDRTAAMLASPKDRFFGSPHLAGNADNHDLNLHKFSRDGIILLGHVNGYEDGKLYFAPDLKENLMKADGFAALIISQIEAYIQKNAMELPEQEVKILDDGFKAPEIRIIDLAEAGIGSIIWATGYSSDYSLVKLPILDSYNYPIADRGVSNFPGLYFVGFNWMNTFNSGFLMSINKSAQYIAENIFAQ